MKNKILILGIALIHTIVYSQTPTNIKKLSTKLISFSYTMGDYDIIQVNKTRKDYSALSLTRNIHLDSLALVRCKRMAKIISQNPDIFCTDEFSTFSREAHRERTTPENTSYRIEGAGVYKDSIQGLKEDDIDLLLTKCLFGIYLAGPGYNKSKSHFENRIKPSYKEYGSYYLVVFVYAKNFNPSGMLKYIPTKLTLHYELFK
jgi:hypothetical protein